MWDWELLKNGSGTHRYNIIAKYHNEDFQYTHAISYGTQQDDYCVHSHAMFEIVYCIHGDVIYKVEEMRYRLEPGSLLILSPAVPHKLFICSDAPFERHVMYVNYAGSLSPLSAWLTQCQHIIPHKRIGSTFYHARDVESLQGDFIRMSRAAASENESIRNLTPYFAYAMAAELMRIIDGKEPALFTQSSSKTIDGLILFLTQNCTKDLTLQSIADTFSISRDYCNRVFRNATGMTVMQYVIYNRVLYAKQLLADGVSAAEAARKSGFSDYSNFYRAYRKITNRKPSDDYELTEGMLKIP